ncbi:MAG: DNA/RNA non-specific endonuclease [Flavobacteriales bacterium]|nr:DNA/RNA non-specific endonuclease [Flavobacteriales bacterium]
MKKVFVFLCVLLLVSLLFFGLQSKKEQPKIVNDFLPFCDSVCVVVNHTYYTLCYNEKHEQAAWVYYVLCDSMILGNAKRKNYFSKDALVFSGTPSHNSYTNSGYDRGHLLPAADMKWNQLAMDETFLMSNVSPQNPYFNQNGLWRKLESKVREWAENRKELIVIVGGVLSDGLPKLDGEDISIPKYYFKIILDKTDFSSSSFLLENSNTSGLLSDFVVSVDSIERISGLDFFTFLPDSLENRIEKSADLSAWF